MSLDLQVLLEFAAPHTGTSDALLLARSRSRWLLVVLVRGLLLERLVPELQRSCTRGLILEQVARVPPAPWADSGPSHPAPGQAGPRFCNAGGAALLLLAAASWNDGGGALLVVVPGVRLEQHVDLRGILHGDGLPASQSPWLSSHALRCHVGDRGADRFLYLHHVR